MGSRIEFGGSGSLFLAIKIGDGGTERRPLLLLYPNLSLHLSSKV
jgi:hypothetical protein